MLVTLVYPQPIFMCAGLISNLLVCWSVLANAEFFLFSCHRAGTSSCCMRSWCDCQWVDMSVIVSPRLMRDRSVMNWSGGVSSFAGLLKLVWHSKPKVPQSTPSLYAINSGFWLLPFHWPPICLFAFWLLNPVIFMLQSLRICLGKRACV